MSKYVRCSRCGKQVSNTVGVDLIVRAFVECPECIEEAEELEATGIQQLKAAIVALIPRVNEFSLEDDFDKKDRDDLVAKMRQLSAV